MNLQQTLHRGFSWGVYAALLVVCMQPGVTWADEEGERERLNLYDRNRRNLRWERERQGYFGGSSPRRSRQSYYDAYQPRGRTRSIEEPDMAPPE